MATREDGGGSGIHHVACLGKMVGEHFRSQLGSIRLPLKQRFRDPPVQVSAATEQQAVAGRILNQGVLELVSGIRRRAAGLHELGINQRH